MSQISRRQFLARSAAGFAGLASTASASDALTEMQRARPAAPKPAPTVFPQLTTLGEFRPSVGRALTPPLSPTEKQAIQARLDGAARVLLGVSNVLGRYYQQGRTVVVASANPEAEARLVDASFRNGAAAGTEGNERNGFQSIVLLPVADLRDTRATSDIRLIELLSQELWRVHQQQLDLGSAPLAIASPGDICKKVISDLTSIRNQWMRAPGQAKDRAALTERLAYLDARILSQREVAVRELRAERVQLVRNRAGKQELTRIDGQIAEHERYLRPQAQR